MNKNFNRTTDTGNLVHDQNLKVTDALFIPLFNEGDEPGIGDNPDAGGAIACQISGDKVIFLVHQGAGIWKEMGGTDILPWSGEQTDMDQFRSNTNGGIEYLFRSLIDNNTSEPTLTTGGPAWTSLGTEAFPPFWDSVTTYADGEFVRLTGGSQNTFRSKVDGNIDHAPVLGTTDEYWEFIGITRGFFPDDAPYNINDIVVDPGSNEVYISNVADNSYALDGQIAGSWQLVGPAIKDDVTDLTATWSSEKISGAIEGSIVAPEAIPFNWNTLPVNDIDMTINGREKYGKYPRIEVWLNIDSNTEAAYNAGRCLKSYSSGVLEHVSFPDIDLEFAESKIGYFLIAK